MRGVGFVVKFFGIGRISVRGRAGGIPFLTSSHLTKSEGRQSAHARRKDSCATMSERKVPRHELINKYVFITR